MCDLRLPAFSASTAVGRKSRRSAGAEKPCRHVEATVVACAAVSHRVHASTQAIRGALRSPVLCSPMTVLGVSFCAERRRGVMYPEQAFRRDGPVRRVRTCVRATSCCQVAGPRCNHLVPDVGTRFWT